VNTHDRSYASLVERTRTAVMREFEVPGIIGVYWLFGHFQRMVEPQRRPWLPPDLQWEGP